MIMANTPVLSRAHLIFGLCLLLAVLLGFALADPLELSSMGLILLVLGLLSVPLWMRFHHPLLILSWNAWITPGFLPGRPFLWAVLALISLLFGAINRSTDPQRRFLIPPSVAGSLFFLSGILIVTALLQGGTGLHALGSERYGGKAYFYIVCAIAGCFALASQPIPRQRAVWYLAMFFLPGITAAMGHLIYLLGPKAYGLFNVFPATYAAEQAFTVERVGTSPDMVRIGGFYYASLAVVCFLIARHGVSGVLDLRRPWRLAFLFLALGACLYSGFRSALILLLLTCAAAFVVEGLHRTKYLVIILALGLAGLMVVLPRLSHMPYVVQRSLSFLPVKVDANVAYDVRGSTTWRIEMWKEVFEQLPRYALLGKGYAIDPNELRLAQESTWRGYAGWRVASVAGDYHNGPLSVVIPLGIWGLLAFAWFLVAGARVLYANYRYGNPGLRTINRFLFAYFLVRIFFFIAVFGSFYTEFSIFTGLVGFGLSLNGGVTRQSPAPASGNFGLIRPLARIEYRPQ
ncbi:MAG TPA: O-antigen ligase family protein [Verrucomicrobiota bacterium]|nr:O-antigen ligase family protein [Verrucomicrobiota bacterium]